MSQSIYDAPNPYNPAPIEEPTPNPTGSVSNAYIAKAEATAAPDPRVGESLRRTRPWTMMFGLLLLLFCGLISIMFFAALFTTFAGSEAQAPGGQTAMNVAAMITFGGVILIYLCPAIHFMRYSSRIGKYLHSPNSSRLADALESQHKFWRFVGVITVIGFLLQVLLISAAIAIPALAMN